jgi:hypothetical protein
MHYALSNVTIGRNIIQEKVDSAIRTTEQVPLLIEQVPLLIDFGRTVTAWYEFVYKANTEELVLYTLKI